LNPPIRPGKHWPAPTLCLREEMQRVVEDAGLANLRVEFDRLFPTVDAPPPYSPALPESTRAKLAAAANEAQLGLAKLHGWIQGLIDEQTLDERMRVEAEEKAKLEGRPRRASRARRARAGRRALLRRRQWPNERRIGQRHRCARALRVT